MSAILQPHLINELNRFLVNSRQQLLFEGYRVALRGQNIPQVSFVILIVKRNF
jgi:hypothetical protein